MPRTGPTWRPVIRQCTSRVVAVDDDRHGLEVEPLDVRRTCPRSTVATSSAPRQVASGKYSTVSGVQNRRSDATSWSLSRSNTQRSSSSGRGLLGQWHHHDLRLALRVLLLPRAAPAGRRRAGAVRPVPRSDGTSLPWRDDHRRRVPRPTATTPSTRTPTIVDRRSATTSSTPGSTASPGRTRRSRWSPTSPG